MTLKETGIEYREYPETLVASLHATPRSRADIQALIDELRQTIPPDLILGPAFCTIQFVTSVKEGFDVEVGFPVSGPDQTRGVRTRVLPPLRVLSLTHRGPLEDIGDSYRILYGRATEHGLISDEFCREIYPLPDDGGEKEIEIQFVLHEWTGLLGANAARVLGDSGREEVMQGVDALDLASTAHARFCWVKGAMQRLNPLATQDQKYDIVSSCAHVFPRGQIAKLAAVYGEARAENGDPMRAVDAVIAFMDADPGWAEGARREGNVIYSSKGPRDPKAYAEAKSEAEKKRAYCFCPLVRDHLDEGMPTHFCYCGAGWYRQQWEGATGKPVRVEILKSLLQGDDLCQFAIHLSPDL
jgi:effector-binding domain-containing protein